MASASARPFSLRPWPAGDKKPKNLGEFIARVNAESGGFRSVAEASLRGAIENDERSPRNEEGSSVSREDGDEDVDNAETDADNIKTITTAREEVLRNIEVAHQSAMMSLDFISLLLSKENPPQARTTLSPALRDLVGIGTLGASKLHESNITETAADEHLAVAAGWRAVGINKMVDSVLAAAERLEKDMEKEAKYWSDVLAVSEGGWAVCPLPQDAHTLGVRYGFSEAAPEFRNSSLVPLRRGDDGSVRLEHGRAGRGSFRVRATVHRNGQVTGHSSLAQPTPEDAPLQDRVLEARNTIFSQELWHEVNREARTLLSLGVVSDGSTVTYDLDPHTQVALSLEDLTEMRDISSVGPDGMLAEAAAISLHCLLSHAHRSNYRSRTFTPHQTSANRANQPYMLLRPLITRARYMKACDEISVFSENLVTALKGAGVSTAQYTKSTQPVAILPQQAAQLRRTSKAEILTSNMIGGLNSEFDLVVTTEARITVRCRSFMAQWIQLHLLATTPPPPNVDDEMESSRKDNQAPPRPSANPLTSFYPPPQEPFLSTPGLLVYLKQATIRSLVHHFASVASNKFGQQSNIGAPQRDVEWSDTPNGPTIVASPASGGREKAEVRIDISYSPPSELSSSGRHRDGVRASKGTLTLSLDGQWYNTPSSEEATDPSAKQDVRTGRWTWDASTHLRSFGEGNTGVAASDQAKESLESVILKVLSGTAG